MTRTERPTAPLNPVDTPTTGVTYRSTRMRAASAWRRTGEGSCWVIQAVVAEEREGRIQGAPRARRVGFGPVAGRRKEGCERRKSTA